MAAALDQPAAEVDPRTDLVLARARGQAVLQERGLCRGAAHVQRDQVRPARQATELAARDDTRCRPRLDEVRRLPRRDRGRKRAAARLHDLERSVDPRVAQAVRERVDVPADGGAEVRVDDGGARALVLADLGEDVGRPRDEDVVGEALAQDLLDPALVGVVGVRVEQRDRHRLDSLLREPRRDVPNGALVERSPDLASRAEALAHLEAKRAGHERLRLLVLQVVEHGDPQPAHLEDVAKALGRHERHGRAATLEDGVRRDGGRMHHAADVRGRDLRVALETAHAGDDAFGVVGGRGEDLRRPDASRRRRGARRP